MNPSSIKPKVGDVLLVQELESHKGKLSVEEDARIVTLFLGTVEKGTDPDVPGRLKKLGWDRFVVYEVTAQFGDGEQRWVHRLNYIAASPKSAALDAVRFARLLEAEEQKSVSTTQLLSIIIRTMRLGMIDEKGKPHNGRGPAFVQWGAESGHTLDDLVKKIECPTN